MRNDHTNNCIRMQQMERPLRKTDVTFTLLASGNVLGENIFRQ